MTFTWSRDIDLREDITIANDTASFLLAGYAETGGNEPERHLLDQPGHRRESPALRSMWARPLSPCTSG